MPSKSFCIMPWTHINTLPDGRVLQCCLGDSQTQDMGNITITPIEEIWNNEKYKTLRKQFMQGEYPTSCNKCFDSEKHTSDSWRLIVNKKFSHLIDDALENTTDDGYYKDFKLAYWDFRFSNLCNMKCTMCSSVYSSMWDNKVTNTRTHSKTDMYQLIDEQIEYVEEIYFAGGEPLIMDEHYYILNKLIESGRTDCRLRYNTNLLKLQFKNHDVFELWKKFDTVRIAVSIDAIDEKAEFIRSGTVWNTIQHNLTRLIEDGHILVSITPTIQVLNVKHLPEFVDKLLSLGITEIWLQNILTGPGLYHINTFGDDDKIEIKYILETHAETFKNDARPLSYEYIKQAYDNIMTYMNEPSDTLIRDRRRFYKEMTHNKDEFIRIFPELQSHYNLCATLE